MRWHVVHERLTDWAGSEAVAHAATRALHAPALHTLVHDPRAVPPSQLEGVQVRTTPLQRLPRALRHRRALLPLWPWAIEQLDLRDADAVLSSHHAVAKGVITRADQPHVCYVHSPARWAWDLAAEEAQARRLRGPKGLLVSRVLHRFRAWDTASANRVDLFLANSNAVAQRIARWYRRPSRVLPPPVRVDHFAFDPGVARGDHYLVAGRLVPYKRAADAVAACAKTQRALRVVGDGPHRKALEGWARAQGAKVEFLGEVSDDRFAQELRQARALLMPQHEDFGIVAVEAMAAGTPVVALGRGGALDTVVPARTGVLYDHPGPQGLADAIQRFESLEGAFDPAELLAHARRFDQAVFEQALSSAAQGFASFFAQHGPAHDLDQRFLHEFDPAA
ncbi:MAG: glycosyltransferase [Planctomycetota bacterium]